MTDREVMQQAIDALLLPTMKTQRMLIQRDKAIIALRRALAEPEQENQALLEWKEKGEVIMAQAGIGFRLGEWWADRPWRKA